jgi:hypothetical protein
MKICVLYTAVTGGGITSDYISRFVATWMEYRPGIECDLMIACNGGPLLSEQSLMFSPLHAQMFPRVNDEGKDITGYQDAARGPCKDYDAMLCLGESIYFTREGWLKRLVEAWQKVGPGFYGPFGNNNVRPHLQTTAFFCPPVLLSRYPNRPHDRPSRMAWEHGENSMWRWVASYGMPVRCVTWDGEWEPRMWRVPKNILWRGDQSNLLMMNNHAQGWENAPLETKQVWSRNADSPFR